MLDHCFPQESGGVLRRSDLLRQGVPVRQLKEAVKNGSLDRVRHGWYATPLADADVVRAVRGGGVMTCVSALGKHGAWVFGREALHVRETEYFARTSFRNRYQVHVCTGPKRDARPCRTAVDSIPDALLVALDCRPEWEFVALLDSLINTNPWNRPPKLEVSEVHDLLRGRGEKAQRAMDLMSTSRDSGCETRFHLELRKRRVRFQSQARVLGHPVDTLIGRRLVVQLDGAEAHDNRAAFHRDRELDRWLVAADYLVIRVTYKQLMTDMESVMRHVLAVIRRGDHLKVPRA